MLQDGEHSLWITTQYEGPLRIGEVADVTGFPDARNNYPTLTQSEITVAVGRAGGYRIATNWSPYWIPTAGCLSRGADGTVRLTVAHPGVVRVDLSVDARGALAALEGDAKQRCAR